MKEEEAKTKWCPYAFAWAQYEDERGCNRDGGGNPSVNSYCIASDCMMWQWSISPETASRRNQESSERYYPNGYCGLTNR